MWQQVALLEFAAGDASGADPGQLAPVARRLRANRPHLKQTSTRQSGRRTRLWVNRVALRGIGREFVNEGPARISSVVKSGSHRMQH